MFDFSERLVESCVVAKPSAFLPFKCEVLAQQPKIGGFRPDLLLSTKDGVLILEIQLRALDRAHLYKTLEYRDLYAASNSDSVPKIALFCENLPDKYLPILKTHNIAVFQFERHDFLRRALAACPKVLVEFVASKSADDSEIPRPPPRVRQGRFDFEPLEWRPWLSPADVRAHFEAELRELGLTKYDLPREYYRIISGDLRSRTNDPYVDTIQTLFQPDAWNWEQLVVDRLGWRDFSKPKISIGCEITSKENFVVWWRERSAYVHGEKDGWLRPASTSTYGYGRPKNELLYVRDAGHLDPTPGIGGRFEEDGDWSSLDSILVSWIAASYREVCVIASTVCDVQLVTDIDVEVSEPHSKGRWGKEQFVTGWSIVSPEEKAKAGSERQLATFVSDFGLSIDAFVEAYNAGRALDASNRALAPSHAITEISRRGGRMDGRQVRETIALLKRAAHPLAARLQLPPS